MSLLGTEIAVIKGTQVMHHSECIKLVPEWKGENSLLNENYVKTYKNYNGKLHIFILAN